MTSSVIKGDWGCRSVPRAVDGMSLPVAAVHDQIVEENLRGLAVLVQRRPPHLERPLPRMVLPRGLRSRRAARPPLAWAAATSDGGMRRRNRDQQCEAVWCEPPGLFAHIARRRNGDRGAF